MIYFNAFIMCGIICVIGQFILENTNLTLGHLNAILVISGAILSFFGIYECMLDFAQAGASIPITNFGHLLFKGAYEGFLSDGMTGLLKGILTTSSGGLSVAIIMAFLVAIFSRPKH